MGIMNDLHTQRETIERSRNRVRADGRSPCAVVLGLHRAVV